MSSEQYLHGVRVIEVTQGTRPIQTVESSIIGIIGTASDADEDIFPLKTPVLVAGRRTEAAKLGTKGTLPWAVDAIFDQIGCFVVMVRVENSTLVEDESVTRGQTSEDMLSKTPVETLVSITYSGHEYIKGQDFVQVGHAVHWNTVSKQHSQAVTRGATDSDVLENEPVSNIKTVAIGLDYYRKGIDFQQEGPQVKWLATGNAPAEGTIYTVVYEQDIAPMEGAVYSVTYRQRLSDANIMANVIGGVDPDTDEYTGMQALLAAQSIVKVTPRILIAPGFTQNTAVLSEMVSIAERLRAVIVPDCPNTTDADAINYREQFGSARIYGGDPWVKVFDTELAMDVMQPSSARVAGMIAKRDNNEGFWVSPSNAVINGITGPARSVDFQLNNPNTRANLLNKNGLWTIIQDDGFRLWGDRTWSDDPKWAFLNVRRTADMINDSIAREHRWAVDRNITKNYVDSVLEGVNNYLRHLKTIGAIVNGEAWADPDFNTPDQIAQGKVYFHFKFTAYRPAEQITFYSQETTEFLIEIFNDSVTEV